MSDNINIIGIGGAGTNITKYIDYGKPTLLNSSTCNSADGVIEKIDFKNQSKDVVIITSPAGQFSSQVLPTVCSTLNSKGKRIFLIAVMPFHFESEERKERAERTMRTVRSMVDSYQIVENENFASAMLDRPWDDVIERINSFVKGILFKHLLHAGSDVQVATQDIQSYPVFQHTTSS
ncbi:MAG: hypothetical protein ACP5UO_02690 [Thermoplasmata archaeon]